MSVYVNDELPENYLVNELEYILIEHATYFGNDDEDYEEFFIYKTPDDFFDYCFRSAIMERFMAKAIERIQYLNNNTGYLYLTNSILQFKTHTPKERAEIIEQYYLSDLYIDEPPEVTSEKDKEFIQIMLKHYEAHFHVFREATENLFKDFKAGLIKSLFNQSPAPVVQVQNERMKTSLSVPELALLFKMLSELKPDIFLVDSKEDLFRFISANFATKKSSEEGISVGKLRTLFATPEMKSFAIWEQHFRTMLVEMKKIKENLSE